MSNIYKGPLSRLPEGYSGLPIHKDQEIYNYLNTFEYEEISNYGLGDRFCYGLVYESYKGVIDQYCLASNDKILQYIYLQGHTFSFVWKIYPGRFNARYLQVQLDRGVLPTYEPYCFELSFKKNTGSRWNIFIYGDTT